LPIGFRRIRSAIPAVAELALAERATVLERERREDALAAA
jgi:hypothetical protein